MSDALSLDFIGTTLRSIQSEQRTLRDENLLIRRELGRMAGAMATRDELLEVLRVLIDRIANSEAMSEVRFDGLNAKFDTLASAITAALPKASP